MRAKIAFLALVCLPFVLLAQQAELGGYVKFFAHPNLNSPYPFDRLGSRIQLRLTGTLGQQAAFYSALDFNYDEAQSSPAFNAPRGQGLNIYPVETYVDLYFSRLDVRLGQQFIFWGKTDWINPTDNINPWDFVNISAEVEDYRLPVTAAKFNLYLGDVTLQAVLVPRFKAHRLPLFTPDSMGGLPVWQAPTQLPKNEIKNAEIGLKADFSLWNVDYSLSYYRGYDKNPTVRMAFDPANHRFIQTISYARQHVFGAAFVTTFEHWAIKGEGAYFLTKDRDGKDIFLQNPYLKYVLGVDFLPNNDWSLNFQFIQSILFKWDENYERSTRQRLGMPLSTLPHRFTQSFSSRVQYQIGDFTSLQLIGVYNLRDGDFFLLPILNYALCDGINVYGGATLFAGPSDSPFGRSKKYSRAFFEVKYSF